VSIKDGVNDAPALSAADIGVAMGAGAALAMESADVTLLDSNLEKIEYCIALGRRVTNVIEQNVIFSLLVKFVVLVLAVTGWTNLWAAIASDVGSMLIVTLNAMKILPPQQQHRHPRKENRMAKNEDIEALISQE
jgi:Zn2+/Cd2+-exporting ATPase